MAGRDGRVERDHELASICGFRSTGEGSSSRRVTTTAALSRTKEPKTHMRAPAATWSLSWDHPKSRGTRRICGIERPIGKAENRRERSSDEVSG